jgi:predicted nucleic acid-binding protein
VNIIAGIVNSFSIIEIDAPKVLQALEINTRYGYSYWDSLIVATAPMCGYSIIYSEDMHHNQVIDGKLNIINPFKE